MKGLPCKQTGASWSITLRAMYIYGGAEQETCRDIETEQETCGRHRERYDCRDDNGGVLERSTHGVP